MGRLKRYGCVIGIREGDKGSALKRAHVEQLVVRALDMRQTGVIIMNGRWGIIGPKLRCRLKQMRQWVYAFHSVCSHYRERNRQLLDCNGDSVSHMQQLTSLYVFKCRKKRSSHGLDSMTRIWQFCFIAVCPSSELHACDFQ